MHDDKLCPFRRIFDALLYEELKQQKMGSAAGLSELFGDCIRDKCAMWRTYEEIDMDKIVAKGYCGLTGSPR